MIQWCIVFGNTDAINVSYPLGLFDGLEAVKILRAKGFSARLRVQTPALVELRELLARASGVTGGQSIDVPLDGHSPELDRFVQVCRDAIQRERAIPRGIANA